MVICQQVIPLLICHEKQTMNEWMNENDRQAMQTSSNCEENAPNKIGAKL